MLILKSCRPVGEVRRLSINWNNTAKTPKLDQLLRFEIGQTTTSPRSDTLATSAQNSLHNIRVGIIVCGIY